MVSFIFDAFAPFDLAGVIGALDFPGVGVGLTGVDPDDVGLVDLARVGEAG